MAKPKGIQPLRMKPLTGSFDSRSLPELVSGDAWRMLQNTRTTSRGKLCRLPGWEKFLSGVATNRAYNNEDLHDQLLTLQLYYDRIEGVDDADVSTYPPNNADFATFCGTTQRTRTQGRQPLTFGAEITSSLSTRHCVVGTQSRLYALNFGKGNWNIIADGLGGTRSNPEIRFSHAALGDYVFFTNNFDEPFYWKIGQGMVGCGMQSVQSIPELQEIGITKIACMASFKGTLFMADVEQDGERRRNRILWSRYQAPLEFVEDPGVSTAGTQDLDFGESIIGMRELGDFLYIYTDRAIWVAVVVASTDQAFAFVRKYRAQKTDGTLVYPFTLTGSKDSHYYMSTDGVYTWNPYILAPVRHEWIHQSSNILYDNLNDSACAAHTAGYSPNTKELWFSCAQGSSQLPSITLTCNTDYGQCSKVDHGFTALFPFTPDTRESVRDWLLNNCIVSEDCLNDPEILALGFDTPKEGAGVAITNPACESFAGSICNKAVLGPNLLPDTYGLENYFTIVLEVGQTYVWTKGANDIDVHNEYDGLLYTNVNGGVFTVVDAPGAYAGRTYFDGICASCPVTGKLQKFTGGQVVGGILTEDGTATDCDEDSICALMGDLSIAEGCKNCEGPSLFIGASATDWCLKTIGAIYARERRTDTGYVLDGYDTIFLKGPMLFGSDTMKMLSNDEAGGGAVKLEFDAEPQTIPSRMKLRVGASRRAEDPLKNCGIKWYEESDRPVQCVDDDRSMEWAAFAVAEAIYLEFKISGTGGASCYSSLQVNVGPGGC